MIPLKSASVTILVTIQLRTSAASEIIPSPASHVDSLARRSIHSTQEPSAWIGGGSGSLWRTPHLDNLSIGERFRMSKYYPPKLNASKFHCPHCHVYARQLWDSVSRPAGGAFIQIQNLVVCGCTHCDRDSFWYCGRMIYPDIAAGPPAHEDMPDDVKADYQEAQTVVARSPKSAAALLRLSVQRLMHHLGEKGKDINGSIGNLVKKGLPVQIQQSLDAVRVIGNESVHPGTMDLNDTPEVAATLFDLLNIIVDTMIGQPKRIAAVYAKLPPDKLKAIQDRDAKKS